MKRLKASAALAGLKSSSLTVRMRCRSRPPLLRSRSRKHRTSANLKVQVLRERRTMLRILRV